MRVETFQAGEARATLYLHEDHDRLQAHRTRPVIVICAGGCYQRLSPREQDPIALRFSALGYQAVILEYSVGARAGAYRPLRELAETVAILRERSAAWHIEPEKIAVLGFSAGGHLAASLGVLWNDPELGLGRQCRPDALALCYPVITAGEFAHRESIETVTGGDPALVEKLSLENHVGRGTPPVFMWHTVDDPAVPVENSLLFAGALRRQGIPFECHLFAHGDHGISVCNREVETPNAACAPWVGLCGTWLNGLFQFEP